MVRGTPGLSDAQGASRDAGDQQALASTDRLMRRRMFRRYGLSFSAASARVAASVAAPASVVRLSDIRWMPRPESCAFLEESVRVLTPIQAISDDNRPYSIFGQ